MSTEHAVDRHRRPGRGRFERGLVVTIGVLAAAVLTLSGAALAQGPRIVDAAIDGERATSLAGSRLVLELNQPVARIEGSVRVSPGEAAEVEADGDRLVVTFARPLPYGTEFEVAVDGVVGTMQPAASDIRHRFTTPDEPVYTLDRRSPSGRSDVVRRSFVGNPEREDVLEAPRLLSFAHTGGVVVGVALEEDDSTTLRIAGLGEETLSLVLPEPGTVRTIAASSTHPIVAFTITAADGPAGRAVGVDPSGGAGGAGSRHTLYVLDVSGVSAAPTAVHGPDGAAIEVANWRFVPGTTSLVVHDAAGAIFLVDAFGLTPPRALGTHAELRGFVPGTTELIVADPDRGSLLDLATGETRPNVLPSAQLPEDSHPVRLHQLDVDGTHLLELRLVAGGVARESLLARVDEEGAVVRYATGPDSRMLAACVSPNGRWVAVETASADAPSDGYPMAPSSTDRLTRVIDIESGEILLTQNGGSSDWCR